MVVEEMGTMVESALVESALVESALVEGTVQVVETVEEVEEERGKYPILPRD